MVSLWGCFCWGDVWLTFNKVGRCWGGKSVGLFLLGDVWLTFNKVGRCWGGKSVGLFLLGRCGCRVVYMDKPAYNKYSVLPTLTRERDV